MRLMVDRNIIYPEGKTIFGESFASFLGLSSDIGSMGHLLNSALVPVTEKGERGENTISYSYIARSIIKLQSLGVLQCDFITTLGTSSINHIDRFHITFFGQKLLEYIEIEHIDADVEDCD